MISMNKRLNKVGIASGAMMSREILSSINTRIINNKALFQGEWILKEISYIVLMFVFLFVIFSFSWMNLFFSVFLYYVCVCVCVCFPSIFCWDWALESITWCNKLGFIYKFISLCFLVSLKYLICIKWLFEHTRPISLTLYMT